MASPIPVTIEVDASNRRGRYRPIWNWVGYDEPNYTYTEHGKKLIDEVISKHLETQRNMLSGLTAEEIEQLALLLKKTEASIVAYDPKASSQDKIPSNA